MSGNHYSDVRSIEYLVEQIREDIEKRRDSYEDEYGYNVKAFSEETIELMEELCEELESVYEKARLLDLLMDGDIGEDEFISDYSDI